MNITLNIKLTTPFTDDNPKSVIHLPLTATSTVVKSVFMRKSLLREIFRCKTARIL